MKKILLTIILFLLFCAQVFATAGSAVQSMATSADNSSIKIKLVCTGDSSNGSLPSAQGIISAAYMAKLNSSTYYLYQVRTYPTPGGTAPDAADVTVTMDGQDLLGGKGTNLIHATATQDTFPYSTFMSMYRYPKITNTLTVGVANEATASCNYTIELIFVR
ncbi:MAG: hypothetical protein M0R74_15830 [Dehalococcoidia bacterium]|nr:hypothetical protein [Dehalococcoidia bacterium]